MYCETSKMVFTLEDFLKSPTPDAVGALRKSDLLQISSHFKLEAKPAMRKFQILEIVLNHFIDEGVFESDVLD